MAERGGEAVAAQVQESEEGRRAGHGRFQSAEERRFRASVFVYFVCNLFVMSVKVMGDFSQQRKDVFVQVCLFSLFICFFFLQFTVIMFYLLVILMSVRKIAKYFSHV